MEKDSARGVNPETTGYRHPLDENALSNKVEFCASTVILQPRMSLIYVNYRTSKRGWEEIRLVFKAIRGNRRWLQADTVH